MRIPFVISNDGRRRTPVNVKFFAGEGELEHALMQIADRAGMIDVAEFQQREYEEIRSEELADMLDAIRSVSKTQVMTEVRESFKAYGYGDWSPLDFVPAEVMEAARAKTRELFPEAYDVQG